MAALTALALAASVGTMAYGAYEQSEGRDAAQGGYAQQQQGAFIQAQAAQAQNRISKEQAAASVDFAGRERDLNQLAAGQSLDFTTQAKAINNNILGLEQQTEAQRRKAMELDARRRQLEVIRNQQRYRAVALTNANAQGAARGSGLQGGYGQISGQSGVNLLGIQQNLQIGQDIFNLNSQVTGQKQQYADLQYNYGLQQASNQTTKSNMMYDYAVSNAAFQTRQADAGTLMSQGQGFVNQGAGQVSMGQMQSQYGSQLFSAGPQLFSMGMSASSVLPTVGSYIYSAGGGYGTYRGIGLG